VVERDKKYYYKYMSKKTLGITLAILAVGLGVYYLKQSQPTPTNTPAAFDPLSATYVIEGKATTLKNGISVTEEALGKDTGATTKTTTRIFGVPVRGDINGDGLADAALLIVQDTGGTGRFYYAAAALNERSGAVGTNAVFLGDRVAPQNIEIRNGQVIANYAERRPTEPFTTQPSIGVSKYLIFDGTALK